MATAAVHVLAPCITSHAWNADCSFVAICPNSSEVHIYSCLPGGDPWERVHILAKHDQLVSDVQWAPISNRIVTCSHDRNSHVWSQDGPGGEWQATLVLLRINRAALAAKWSPKENKFAVASGSRAVCVCYYEAENDWWVSKQVRKKHSSSVTSLAWGPDNVLLATTSTDGRCRIFSAFVKGVDSKINAVSSFGDRKFGEQLLELDLGSGWAFGMQWSPSGEQMAFVGHDSTLHLVSDVGPAVRSQTISLASLPLKAVLFLSDDLVVGGGYECLPTLFTRRTSTGQWMFAQCLDNPERGLSDTRSPGSQVSNAVGKWTANTTGANGIEPLPTPTTTHSNTITSILPISRNRHGVVNRFSTSGLDGKVVIWTVPERVLQQTKVDQGVSLDGLALV